MNQNPAISQNPEQPPPTQSKKKPRQNFTLKPQHFQKQNGIQALYKAIEHIDLTKGQDLVQQSMKKIIVTLKTWHFQMLPKYSFDYFLQRCKKLGDNKFTQAYMAKVRKIHKGQDSWGNQSPKEDELKNVNLDHLNPNLNQPFQIKQNEESLDKKIQRAMKIVNQISGGVQQSNQNNGNKMELEDDYVIANQKEKIEKDSDSDSEVEDLFKQMENLEKQKKLLFSTKRQQNHKKQQIQANRVQQKLKKQNNKNHQSQQQAPYVPEGFDQIDYGQQSSEFQG